MYKTYFRDVKIKKWCALVFADSINENIVTFLSGFLPCENISLMEYKQFSCFDMITIDKGKPNRSVLHLETKPNIFENEHQDILQKYN